MNAGQFKKGQEPHNKGSKKMISKNCLKCNTNFEYPDWKMNENREFCSRGCAVGYRTLGKITHLKSRIKQSLAKTKEKEFSGFRNSFGTRIRLLNEYLTWRSEVFKRDNYHCQGCGEKGYLEAHHIIQFSIILKEFNIKTLEQAKDCKELWEVGNGITYCLDCHNLLGNKGGELKLSILN